MRNEWKSIGVSSGLILANIVLIGLLAPTIVAELVLQLFSTLILGVVVYGAILTGGTYLAKNGVREENMARAGIGIGLLQLGYGSFGAAVLSVVPQTLFVEALAVTAGVSVAIAAGAAGLVYGTGRDFSSFRRYATYLFLGVLLMALIGTFTSAVAAVAFVLALAAFILLLIWEIWRTKKSPDQVLLNGLGIYIAFMGVFVHILQLVVEMYLTE